MSLPFSTTIKNLLVFAAPVVDNDNAFATWDAVATTVTPSCAVRLVASMSPPMAVRSKVAAPPVLTTASVSAPILPPLVMVMGALARSIVTPAPGMTPERSLVAARLVTTMSPGPSTSLPETLDAATVRVTLVSTVVATVSSSVPVKVTSSVTVTLLSALPPMVVRSTATSPLPMVTSSAPVPALLTVSPATLLAAAVIVKVSPTVTTAPSSVPVKVTLPSKAAVVVVASSPLRSAAGVACNAVTATVPTPVAVLPWSWAAVPCNTASVPTLNVAVPSVAVSMLKMSAAPPAVPVSVTTALPRLPEKLTVASVRDASAVTLLVVRPERLAAAVACSAVTATVPSPVAVSPVICAAVAVSVQVSSTLYASIVVRLALPVMSMLELTRALTPPTGLTFVSTESAASARMLMEPSPSTVLPVTWAALAVSVLPLATV